MSDKRYYSDRKGGDFMCFCKSALLNAELYARSNEVCLA